MSLQRLHDQIGKLEDSLADVCADYSELHQEISPFLARYQADIVPFQDKLVEVKREIADLRVMLGDLSAQQPGSGETPLTRLLDTQNKSVEEQYKSAWAVKDIDTTTKPAHKPASDELKQMYRKLIPQVFPGFGKNDAEVEHRLMLFKRANFAYAKRDARALKAMLDSHASKPTNLPALVNDDLERELRDYVYDLEKAIARIEGETFDLRYGDVGRLYEMDKEDVNFLKNLKKEMKAALREAVTERDRLREQV